MEISVEAHGLLTQSMSGLQQARYPFWQLWRELADFYLPKRYVWLQSAVERRVRNAKNPNILDGTGTKAARILAAGMMNGITSPSRPWFSLRVSGFTDDPNSNARKWVDEVTRRMLIVMGETNFYNALATMYLDLVVFGTAAMLIYEDDSNVFRCFNPALGEYYLAQDDNLQVDTFAREFTYTVKQTVNRWGVENCSERVQQAWKKGGADLQQPVEIHHLVEPNKGGPTKDISKRFAWRETYWEKGRTDGQVLSRKGFNEAPGVFPRWELTANDSYGTSPGMDALPDVLQLQQETRRKGQGLDKTVSPPMLADIQLKGQPTALLPNGITYIAGNNSFGAKPMYQVQLPLADMTVDIRDIRSRIEEIFHNPLFNMISQLETVRSATEIDARREEKLVLLGSVLERFQNEALDPGVNRIFSIMNRLKMFPPPPDEIAGQDIEIQYVSILSTAQRAVGAIPTERFIAMVGQMANAYPEALDIPNPTEMLRNYAESIGVPARDLNSRQTVAEKRKVRLEEQQQAQSMQQAQVAIAGAQQLSETDVGGGANALQMMLGG